MVIILKNLNKFYTVCIFCCIFTLLVLIILLFIKVQEPSMIFSKLSENNGNEWGIWYPNPGETPEGEEDADYLREFDAYYVGNGSDKVIYLTFDGGYENGYTEQILDTLKSNQVPAIFFLTGNYIKKNPEIVNRMVNEGHLVGNHTMSHPDMRKQNKSSFAEQLFLTEEAYESATGCEMQKYYRPPCGRYSEANLKMAQELGYKTIFWSLAYNDYNDKKQPSKEDAFSKLIPRIHPGAVILLHSTSKTSTLLLDELINRYRQMGYEFRSIDCLTDY
jgi:peptidoglycan-N-acetylmuramic acid deacetylase